MHEDLEGGVRERVGAGPDAMYGDHFAHEDVAAVRQRRETVRLHSQPVTRLWLLQHLAEVLVSFRQDFQALLWGPTQRVCFVQDGSSWQLEERRGGAAGVLSKLKHVY